MADDLEETRPSEPMGIIDEFEAFGFATFKMGENVEDYDRLVAYTQKHLIATFTEIDDKEGTITLIKRPFGSLEGVGIL